MLENTCFLKASNFIPMVLLLTLSSQQGQPFVHWETNRSYWHAGVPGFLREREVLVMFHSSHSHVLKLSPHPRVPKLTDFGQLVALVINGIEAGRYSGGGLPVDDPKLGPPRLQGKVQNWFCQIDYYCTTGSKTTKTYP